ncbi:hypothetical protein [Nocardia sp. NPDC004860]|uniref:hypothetical protein n=1 Tax=Nocardia sp. NPDC004860 TaxID=3154557 RepID=UPI0033B9649C
MPDNQSERATQPATSHEREYRLTYSDPATGEEFVIGSDSIDWRYKRDALINAGYDVTSETRADSESPWTPAKDAA